MKLKLISILFLIPSFSFSQIKEVKWKEVSEYEKNLKEINFALGASAVVLFDIENLYFGTNPNGQRLFLFRKRHVRIKILTEEGLKYAKAKVLFHNLHCEQYFGENSLVLKAQTLYQEKGKTKAYKLNKKTIQYKDTTNCHQIATFTFPNVKVGSIIEYIYTIPTLELENPHSKIFNQSIPVLYSEFSARIPSNLQYIFSAPDIPFFDVQQQSNYSSLDNFPVKVRGQTRFVRINLSGIKYQFALKNLQAAKPNKDGFIDELKMNIFLAQVKQHSDYYEWQFLAKALMITTFDSYENRNPGQRKLLSFPAAYKYTPDDWPEINKKLLENKNFGLPLTIYLQNEFLKQLKAEKISEEEKTKKAYEYIKQNISWNKQFSIYLSEEKKNRHLISVLKNKKGKSSEINMLLIAFLRQLDIKAHPILINTNNYGKIDTIVHSIYQFNTVNVFVETENKSFVLDASNNKSSFENLPPNMNNRLGLIIRKEGPKWFLVQEE